MRKALVCGAGGFICGHLVTPLNAEGGIESIGWSADFPLLAGIGRTYPASNCRCRRRV